jgi:pectin-derived oligosaccharide transport system substrate-binding protein
MKRYRTVCMAAVAVAGLLLAGCGSGSKSSATAAAGATKEAVIAKSDAPASFTFSWWGTGNRDKLTNAVIEQFQKKYPQITITGQPNPSFPNYFNKLNVEIASGDVPDLIQMDMRYIGTYVAKDLLLNLDRLAPGTLDTSDFDASLLSQGQIHGGLYGVPLGGNLVGTLYNTALFAKAGVSPWTQPPTWDEFADIAKAMAPKLPQGSWPVDDESGSIVAFEMYVRQFGGELYTSDGHFAFTRQQVVDWFTYWSNLRAAHACVPADISAASAAATVRADTVIATGKAAMFMTNSTALAQTQPFIKDKLSFIPLPEGGSGSASSVFLKASMLVSLWGKAKYPSQAGQFINYWINDPDAGKILMMERGVPGAHRIQDAIASLLDPVQQIELAFVESQAKIARPKAVLDPAGADAVGQALLRDAESISLGGSSIDAAADKFMNDAAKAISG